MTEQDNNTNLNQNTNPNQDIDIVQEQTPWQKNRDRQIKIIQDTAAACPTLTNGVKKELTFQQCLSIWLRSKQLIREANFHPCLINSAKKKEQIEVCYRQRTQNRNN